ncbi:MAG TPA: NAD(P)-dependent oxidoreductase [Planctomycetota bacterium]|nr:NAD(P)-dependent oxidoreductase [Planctomycetota bacterium]
MHFPAVITSEEQLDDVMSQPPPELIELMKKLDGDIMILGIGGKMGSTLGQEAVRAVQAAGVKKTVYGVSRFSDAATREKLEKLGLKTIACDLLERDAIAKLPLIPNIVFMAGRKFGTSDSEALTWAMNTVVPSNVGHHFQKSRIVAFSSGNVYGDVHVYSGGATEEVPPNPDGEYAQSVLGRERVFAYYCQKNNTPTALIRLNYAIDLRYGVLYEIAKQINAGEPVDVTTGHVNVIWQGDANTQALLALQHCTVPANIINCTGPETLSIRYAATELGRLLQKKVVFKGAEGERVLLNNASKAARLYGYPRVSMRQMFEWTAEWVKAGGRSLNKPTHFEVRDGKF